MVSCSWCVLCIGHVIDERYLQLWKDDSLEWAALNPPPSYQKANRMAAIKAQHDKDVAAGTLPSGDGAKAAGEKPKAPVAAVPIVTGSLTQEQKSKPMPSKTRELYF